MSCILALIGLVLLCSVGRNRNTINVRKSESDSVPKILYDYLPQIQKITTDSIVYPYEPFYDDSTGNFVAIGHLVSSDEFHAVSTSFKDSSLTFFRYDAPEWKIIGKEKLPDFVFLETQDLDNDGRREILTRTPPNMNGNCGYNIFYLSEKRQGVHFSGYLFGRFEPMPNAQVHYIYEGSWYMPYTQTLYEWRNEKLIPVREVSVELKKANMRTNAQWITFSENPTYDKDTLVVKFKKTYRERKHAKLVDEFFGKKQTEQ
ncbi:MAG: hypothetical protein EOO50_09360 [Flavobacterium sp.]|uniref:hypothetical protein n=1 Tax=Flavobacterium sp. TaxID=239 RepID=UPI00122349C0|nr:hypothetical protein [Flavobacterium sp.]RZJ66570.1 MAG: hypothetical protein EOO50_09360 [Flavobacterium sp.]